MHFGHFVHNTNHRHHRRVLDFGCWTVGRCTGGCLVLPQNSPNFHHRRHPNHRHHRRVVASGAWTVECSTGGHFGPPQKSPNFHHRCHPNHRHHRTNRCWRGPTGQPHCNGCYYPHLQQLNKYCCTT